MKNENGISLISLMVTIVILIIIASIGLRNLTGDNSNVDIANKQVLLYNIQQIQHAVLETELIYIQTQGQSKLYGTKIDNWQTAMDYLDIVNNAVNGDEEDNLNLLIESNEYEPSIDAKCYYEINIDDLKEMGFNNIDLESFGLARDEENTIIFIVNYYTGEVFNVTIGATEDHTPLYIKAK